MIHNTNIQEAVMWANRYEYLRAHNKHYKPSEHWYWCNILGLLETAIIVKDWQIKDDS